MLNSFPMLISLGSVLFVLLIVAMLVFLLFAPLKLYSIDKTLKEIAKRLDEK